MRVDGAEDAWVGIGIKPKHITTASVNDNSRFKTCFLLVAMNNNTSLSFSPKRPCSAAGAANPCELHGKLLLILNLAKKIAFCCDMQKAKKNIRGGVNERHWLYFLGSCRNQVFCLRHGVLKLPNSIMNGDNVYVYGICHNGGPVGDCRGTSSPSGCLQILLVAKRSEDACGSDKHPRLSL